MSKERPRRTGRNPEDGRRLERHRRGERLVAVLLAGAAALNHPVLSIFDETVLVLGIPALYLYVFSAWALVIAAAALVLRDPGEP